MFPTSFNNDNVLDLSLWKCEVCADIARGKHYRVLCCDGCKGFFKRNHTKVDDLSCVSGKRYLCGCQNIYHLWKSLGSNNCDVDRRNRTNCKLCRLKKCLDVGMRLGGFSNLDSFSSTTSSFGNDSFKTYTYEFINNWEFVDHGMQ